MVDVNLDVAGNIPGKDGDRKTPRGELNWIFTAITGTLLVTCRCVFCLLNLNI